MILLPAMSDPEAGVRALATATVKAAVFLVLMFVGGTRILPRLMQIIAVRQSRELFLLAITAIGLGVGYATYLFGLSFAFGAFVAGLVLSESDYAHQALLDIADLRLRSRTGATIVGIMRSGAMIANPSPDESLASGDLLAIAGTPEQRRRLADLADTQVIGAGLNL